MKWQSYKLKEVGEVVTGNTPPTTQREYYGTQYKFIKPTDMREGQRYVPVTEEYYSELAYQKYRKSLLPVNTPCVVTIGSLGKKMCLTDEPSFTNQAVNAVIPNENFDGEFLYYCLRTRLPYVKQLDSGTTSGRENVSKSSFSNIVIEAPSLAIQKRIASILSAYDNLIENNNKRIKILEQMAENLYKEWFVRFRFPGHESTPLENGIPKGWNVEKTGKFCKIITGKKDANEASGNGLYPFFTCARETNLSTDEYILDTNAILISGNGSFTGFVKKFSGKFDLYQRTYALYDFIDVEWLYLYWTFKFEFEREYMGGSHGSAIPYITKPNIEKFKIIVPSKDIQKRSQEIFEYVHLECIKLRDENNNLIKQRDLLLPRLMSGELAV